MKTNETKNDEITVVAARTTAFLVDECTREIDTVEEDGRPNVHAAFELRVRDGDGSVLCEARAEIFREETFSAACEARGGNLAKIEHYLTTRDGLFMDDFRLDATDEYEPLVVVLSDVTLHPAAAYRHADDVLFRNVRTVANHHFPGQIDAIVYDPRRDENRTPNIDPRVTAVNVGYRRVEGDGLTLYVPRRAFCLNTVIPAW